MKVVTGMAQQKFLWQSIKFYLSFCFK